MSIIGPSSTTTTTPDASIHTMLKKQFHRRNESDELHVFEAAKYYSGYSNDMRPWRGGRMSLDLPPMLTSSKTNTPLLGHDHIQHDQHVTKLESQIFKDQKSKSKHKQPRSPGGRLASFLNSLFNQTSSKKKKSKKMSNSDIKDCDQDHHEALSQSGIRRKLRRSSISHFGSSSSETKSLYSSSSTTSGFRTPPSCNNFNYNITPTPTKSLLYKDFKNKQVVSLPQHIEHNMKDQDLITCLDEEVKLKVGFNEKNKNIDEKDHWVTSWVDNYQSEERKLRKYRDGCDQELADGDGWESDSSSDLFELQNYDLGLLESSNDHGLPVYETTHINSIKRGAPIYNGV